MDNNNLNVNNGNYKYRNNYYSNNVLATILKIISIFGFIVGVYYLVSSDNEFYTIAVISSSLFTYVLAEIIQILHDIRTNTEQIRDEQEKKK